MNNSGKHTSRQDPVRYGRHLALPEIGIQGQKAISRARVLIIGAGGLGCPVIQYLAAAGVGTLGIADNDVVEVSNLQRQVLYGDSDVGKLKAIRAGARAASLNPAGTFNLITSRITAENVLEVIPDYDIVVDCTDNFPTRYLLNDACVLQDKTFVYGSVYRFEGQVSVFNALLKDTQRGPNYRDLFPEPPPADLLPDCSQAGVIGCLPGIIGSVQAMEVIKIITGAGQPLSGRLFIFDSLTMETRSITIADQKTRNSITEIKQQETPDSDSNTNNLISPLLLKNWITDTRSFELLDVREPFEREIVSLGGKAIPLGQLETKAHELPVDRPLVVYCKSGGRSAQAIQTLTGLGFGNLYNLEGGILAWIREVDPELPGY